MEIKIQVKNCMGCGNCVNACPFGVLSLANNKAVVVDDSKCVKCGACLSACPTKAIEIKE